MEISDEQQKELEAKSMRDLGIALTTASLVLLLFVFVPIRSVPNQSAAVVTAPAEPAAPDAYAHVPLEAKAAIVYDLTTGATLYAKNADAQLPLASLTKLLAVYAALRSLPESAPVTITSSSTLVDAPRAFREGQVLSLRDISRLTLTASLNDGASAIVSAAAAKAQRTESEVLSSAASSLSLSQTYALNGSGLDVSSTVSGGYGSARDIARLAGALAAKAPKIAAATTRSSARASSEGGTAFNVHNTDPMVGSIPHLLLSKTGFTDLAGGNLALVFDAGINHPIAVVVMGSSIDARFTDANALVAATLAHFAGVASL